MKRKAYKFSINKPCTEEWDSMQPTGSGKFCVSCQHTVLDFTKLTDNEIIRLIEKSEGKICGRFSPMQLNRIMEQTPEPSRNSGLYRILAGLLLLASADVTAQKPKTASTVVPTYTWRNANELKWDSTSAASDTVNKNLLRGVVINEQTKAPIYKAGVLLAGTTLSTFTDGNGKFEITVPDSLLTHPIKLLVASYEVSTELTIAPNELQGIKTISLPYYVVPIGRLSGFVNVEVVQPPKRKHKK